MNDNIYILLLLPGIMFTSVFFISLWIGIVNNKMTFRCIFKSSDRVLMILGLIGILCLVVAIPRVYSQISAEIQLKSSISELMNKSRAHSVLVGSFNSCIHAAFKTENECIIEMRQMADVHQLNEEFAEVLEDLQPILDDFHNQDE